MRAELGSGSVSRPRLRLMTASGLGLGSGSASCCGVFCQYFCLLILVLVSGLLTRHRGRRGWGVEVGCPTVQHGCFLFSEHPFLSLLVAESLTAVEPRIAVERLIAGCWFWGF